MGAKGKEKEMTWLDIVYSIFLLEASLMLVAGMWLLFQALRHFRKNRPVTYHEFREFRNDMLCAVVATTLGILSSVLFLFGLKVPLLIFEMRFFVFLGCVVASYLFWMFCIKMQQRSLST